MMILTIGALFITGTCMLLDGHRTGRQIEATVLAAYPQINKRKFVAKSPTVTGKIQKG